MKLEICRNAKNEKEICFGGLNQTGHFHIFLLTSNLPGAKKVLRNLKWGENARKGKIQSDRFYERPV